ncbi:MAG: hypothetical protein KJZ57_07470, partial [Anaerolineales bacterium]|nr:hypothetical protein [Anaerolineales bacterium]
MKRDLRQLFTLPVLLGATGLAGLLTVLTMTWFGFSAPPPSDPGLAPAYLTLIPAPTSTPRAAPTPTPDLLLAGTPTLPADAIV